MTTITRTQNGAMHLVLLLALVVVAVAAFVGYRVINDQTGDTTSSQQTTVAQTPVPENITNASDLEQATKAANQTPVDNDLNPNQLDQDVESLL